MTIQVPISRGLVTLIDDQDASTVLPFRWYAVPASRPVGLFYARRNVGRAGLFLHRALLNAAAGLVVDHINGDGLDNRRANLRVASHWQNALNSRQRVGAFGYRGVQRSDPSCRFKAVIYIKGRATYRGGFDTPEAAARAFDAMAREHYGEFAVLNFPDEPKQGSDALMCPARPAEAA
jgi:hypothetical protein